MLSNANNCETKDRFEHGKSHGYGGALITWVLPCIHGKYDGMAKLIQYDFCHAVWVLWYSMGFVMPLLVWRWESGVYSCVHQYHFHSSVFASYIICIDIEDCPDVSLCDPTRLSHNIREAYKCDKCPYSSAGKGYLQRHKISHDKEKKYLRNI